MSDNMASAAIDVEKEANSLKDDIEFFQIEN